MPTKKVKKAVEAPAPEPAPESKQSESVVPRDGSHAPPEPAGGQEPAGRESGAALLELPEQAVQRVAEELAQLRDQYLRLAADHDNFRKRIARERTETWSRAQAEVVGNILDALDDLGRVAHLDPERAAVKDVLAGVELVERKILKELEGAGLERVGQSGETFDPHRHEAVSTVPAPSAEQDHLVAAVLQPGYRFGGALLRPARVEVQIWRDGPAPDAGSEAEG